MNDKQTITRQNKKQTKRKDGRNTSPTLLSSTFPTLLQGIFNDKSEKLKLKTEKKTGNSCKQ